MVLYVSKYLHSNKEVIMNKKKKSIRMSRDDRRAQIIDSAMEVFVRKGYNGATTADIADEAGISEVTLFRHFDSKKELFMAGLEPILITSLEDSISESEDLEPIEKLKYILKDRIDFVSTHNKTIKLILMESQINPEIAEFDYIDKVLALLKDSIERAGIELEDEQLSLRMMMGSILSFLYLPETDEEKVEKYVEKLIKTIKY